MPRPVTGDVISYTVSYRGVTLAIKTHFGFSNGNTVVLPFPYLF